MSVYTEVTRDELIVFLGDYTVGELVAYQGTDQGIENTNYFVTTTQGQFVLTLFEQHDASELAYFFAVIAFFYQHDIPSACPQKDCHGEHLKTLCGKPATLVTRLSGRIVSSVASIAQCQAIGDVLGRMHVVSHKFDLKRITQRGDKWRQQVAMRLLPQLDSAHASILSEELHFQAKYIDLDLPSGVTHSDLFRDNALFDGDVLSGVIDFYYACDEYLLYDLAVAINDWCIAETGLIDVDRYHALMTAYQQKRPLLAVEQNHLNLVLRVAALRFWLSRLQAKFYSRQVKSGQPKDPDVFLKVLQHHRQYEAHQ